MPELLSEEFRLNMGRAEDALRDLCSQRIPHEVFRFTVSQVRMIRCIYKMTGKNDEGILLKQLANELEITPAATSEMVDTLVRRGALERKSNPHDRRAVAIRLSREWNNRFLSYEKQLNKLMDNFFVNVDPAKRDVAVEVMKDLAAFLANQKSLPEME